MRNYLILLVLLPILAFFNYSIYQKESLKAEAELIYFKLAPVDPRSLMQGDYMRLRYQISLDAEKHLRAEGQSNKEMSATHLVIAVDEAGYSTFIRFHDGKAGLAANERLIAFEKRGTGSFTQIYIHPDSFFFQEGHAKAFEEAKFGMIRLGTEAEHLLVGLADENGTEIKPE